MKFDFLKAMKFQSGEAIISRSAGRAVVGMLNAQIINLIGLHLRSQRMGAPVENPTIDTHAETVGEVEGEAANEKRSEEQGGALPREKPLVTAGRLKLLRDSIDKSLRANCGMRELPLAGKDGRVQLVPDEFHIGQSIEATMAFMCSSVQEVSPQVVKEQAAALGITEDEVKKALANRPAARQQFLFRNKDEILGAAKTLAPEDKDGLLMSVDNDQAAFDLLEPITRSSLMACADRALYKAWQREIQRHVDGQIDAMSNIGLLNGIRVQLREEFREWMKDNAFYRSYNEAIERGAKSPQFGALPTPTRPMEHETVTRRAA